MMFIEVLCEGASDVPAVREVLTRRFKLVEERHFRIHPHRGKGTLPPFDGLLRQPVPGRDLLLDLLPIKLKNMGRQSVPGLDLAVVVLVDADRDDCRVLKNALLEVYRRLPSKPARCLFRIAVEETESWFIAEPDAVKSAYPTASKQDLVNIPPDSVCGAWEKLAECIGRVPADCDGGDKIEWAKSIAPHLNLDAPRSPSLEAFIVGVASLLER